jgi:YfiH family protein
MAIVVGHLGPRARYAFSDRNDGVSAAPFDAMNLADHVGDAMGDVLANRDVLARAVDLDVAHLVTMAPIHGNDVASVRGPSAEPVPEVDALVTSVPGLALLVLAADCVPVVLADGASGVVAVVHAGWRGVLADVVGTTLAAMADQGARSDRMRAVVGPAICGSCYGVPRDRFDAVVAVAPAAAAVAAGGRPGLDLRAAVVERLRAAGVGVSLHGGCTFESAELYSFRRDGVTGRHGGVVALLPEGAS